MTEEKFWAIIASFDWSADDHDAAVEPAITTLTERGFDEICAFEEFLADKLYSLDTEAHARHIGEGAYTGDAPEGYPACADGSFFSVDGFLYARCAVVGQGKDLYEQVLNQPEKFPPDVEFEALLSIGLMAFERTVGDDYVHTTAFNYETFSNHKGWKHAQKQSE